MSHFAMVAGLWQSYLSMSLLVWLLCTAATWHLLRRGVGLDWPHSLFALVLFEAGAPFTLGATSAYQGAMLIPGSMCWPFLTFMVTCALRRWWWWFVAAAVLAVFIHPLLVGGAAAILIGTVVIDEASRPGIKGGRVGAALVRPFLAAVIFGAAYALIWLLPLGSSSAPRPGLGEILIARAPQHYSPAFFWRRETPGLVMALAAFALSGWGLLRLKAAPATGVLRFIVVASGLTLLVWLAGALGVEMLHNDFVTIAQVFRFTFIPGWLGTVLVGSFAATCVERSGWMSLPGALLVLGGFLVQDGGVILLAVAALAIPVWWKDSRTWIFVLVISGLSIAAGLRFAHLAWKRHLALLVVLGGAWLFSRYFGSKAWGRAAILLGALVASISIMLSAGRHWPLVPPTVLRIEDAHDLLDGAASYAGTHTDRDELFLTPPLGERFRLVAQRAIVVGALGFPNRPELFFEWKRRMLDCYGSAETERDAKLMDASYHALRDQQIKSLGQSYGFKYAVLFRETPTILPEVYEDNVYKIVALGSFK
jgi:hypothetical protein